MIKLTRKIRPAYFLIDFFILGASFYFPYLLMYNSENTLFHSPVLPHLREYSFICILWSALIVISFTRRNLYCTDRSITIPKEIYSVFTSILFSGILTASFIFFAQYKFFSRKVFLADLVLFFIFLSVWRTVKRLILRRLISRGFNNINILIIGIGEKSRIAIEEVKRIPWWGFKVVGFLDEKQDTTVDGVPVLGTTQDFLSVVKKHFIEEVIICDTLTRKNVLELIGEAKKLHLGIRVIPEDFIESIASSDVNYLGTLPLLTYKERTYHPADLAAKRLFDFVASLISLVVLFPLFIIIAVLIKLDSEGPVFYIQKRVGIKRMPFKLYKFRSMIKNADELRASLLEENEVKDGVIFKIKKDPRMTRVGRFLRKHSLDEFPQLFNVLKGDISLVGPRPPIYDEVEQYNYNQMHRLSIRPGITGLSQIKGRSDLTFKKWVKWDLWYINNWSSRLDIWILWQSIISIMKGAGAY